VEEHVPGLLVAAPEEALSFEHLEEEEPEREDVAARIDAGAGDLLGRRVRDARRRRRGRKAESSARGGASR